MHKPILSLDFDGVIHSYTSGWKGPRTIPDDPVPGALEFIVEALKHFQVHIFSSRSRYLFGRRAMKKWLYGHLMDLTYKGYAETPEFYQRRIGETAFADPWYDEADYATKKLIREIKWPTHKPPALITIDDRAICFTGDWPSMESIQSFSPWYK